MVDAYTEEPTASIAALEQAVERAVAQALRLPERLAAMLRPDTDAGSHPTLYCWVLGAAFHAYVQMGLPSAWPPQSVELLQLLMVMFLRFCTAVDGRWAYDPACAAGGRTHAVARLAADVVRLAHTTGNQLIAGDLGEWARRSCAARAAARVDQSPCVVTPLAVSAIECMMHSGAHALVVGFALWLEGLRPWGTGEVDITMQVGLRGRDVVTYYLLVGQAALSHGALVEVRSGRELVRLAVHCFTVLGAAAKEPLVRELPKPYRDIVRCYRVLAQLWAVETAGDLRALWSNAAFTRALAESGGRGPETDMPEEIGYHELEAALEQFQLEAAVHQLLSEYTRFFEAVAGLRFELAQEVGHALEEQVSEELYPQPTPVVPMSRHLLLPLMKRIQLVVSDSVETEASPVDLGRVADDIRYYEAVLDTVSKQEAVQRERESSGVGMEGE